MHAIRAHFDGVSIVPDQPLSIPAQTRFIVLVDEDSDDAMAKLNRAAKEYYQNQTPEEIAEDEAWGRAMESGSKEAWDGE
jgi:hypothetical protein